MSDIYFINFENALILAQYNLHNSNESNKTEILKSLQLKIFPDNLNKDINIEKLHSYLEREIENISQKTRSEKSKVDLRLTKVINKFFNIDLKTGANAEFWGGLCICDEVICKFINSRYDYIDKEGFFLKPHTENFSQNQIYRIRNFCPQSGPTNVVRNYFAQIWWIAKIVPVKYYDLIWAHQDTVNSFLQRMVGFIDNEGKPTQFVEIVFDFLEKYERIGVFKNQRRIKIRKLLMWLLALQKTKPIHLYTKNELKQNIEQIFNHVIGDTEKFFQSSLKNQEILSNKVKQTQKTFDEFILDK